MGEKYSQEGPLTGEVDDQAHEDAVSENFDSDVAKNAVKKADSTSKLDTPEMPDISYEPEEERFLTKRRGKPLQEQ